MRMPEIISRIILISAVALLTVIILKSLKVDSVVYKDEIRVNNLTSLDVEIKEKEVSGHQYIEIKIHNAVSDEVNSVLVHSPNCFCN